jgi:NADH:ubiquinone oxidoreductase subunit F (NADH-binding)
MNDLIKKIEKAGLRGRGGTGFPIHRKWQSVINASGDEKFVICNASEGEPGVKKDWELLSQNMDDVFDGMRLACTLIGAKKCWINCNYEYLQKLREKLDKQVLRLAKHDIELVVFEEKKDSYLGGESSTIMNVIEGKKEIPRSKIFHATEHGLWEKPTLINNVESFYDVAMVAADTYDFTRLYTILGDVKNSGVYRFPVEMSIEDILEKTNNQVAPEAFLQIGGGACGEIKRGNDLKEVASGAGSIEVFPLKTTPKEILIRWLEFFEKNLCGTCTPCRDGVPQILNLIHKNEDLLWENILEITEVQRATAFCGLGRSIDTPIRSLHESLQK